MVIKRFEDIESWKEARKLVKEVYGIFAACRDYGFRDQIQRASISIMSNIAEGFDRGSNKEYVQLLTVARGSASEVRSLSYAALDVGHIDQKIFETVQSRCTAISNLINGFIKYLRTSSRKK